MIDYILAAVIDWPTFWSSVLGSTVLISFLGFVSKAWITERISQSIKHEYNQKLESFKNGLRAEAFQQEVKFSQLQEQRQAIITDVYRKLRALRNAVQQCINFQNDLDLKNPITQEQLDATAESFNELNKSFIDNYILIPKVAAEAIANLKKEYFFTVRKAIDFQNTAGVSPESASKVLLECISKVHEALNSDFDQVEELLREALEPKAIEA